MPARLSRNSDIASRLQREALHRLGAAGAFGNLLSLQQFVYLYSPKKELGISNEQI
jgi:hypothetical protein